MPPHFAAPDTVPRPAFLYELQEVSRSHAGTGAPRKAPAGPPTLPPTYPSGTAIDGAEPPDVAPGPVPSTGDLLTRTEPI